MLPSLVEKIWHLLLAKRRLSQYMLMVIVTPSLILILTVVSGIQQKSDTCQGLKSLSSNLTASQNTALKEIISKTYVFGDKMTKY